jgi:DNA-binding XRE family transcriptional regulator
VDEPPSLTFGALLKRLREQAGMTQEELAQAARLGVRTISDLERGVARTAFATALQALGIPHGSTIGVPALDWNATSAVARAIGISTIPLPVTSQSGLLDTGYLAHCPQMTQGLAAVVAVHLHGLTCDIPALRRARPGLLIVEDAAQAWRARYPDGRPVGSAARACVFSFGAAKSPCAGELGCLVTRALPLHRQAVALTQHPTRQLLTGITSPTQDRPMVRAAPAAALLGAYAIHRHTAQLARLRQAAMLVASQLRNADLPVLTDPALHAPGTVAVRAGPQAAHTSLGRAALGHDVTVAVDQADLHLHPDVADDRVLRDLATAITVVSVKLADAPAGGGPGRREPLGPGAPA